MLLRKLRVYLLKWEAAIFVLSFRNRVRNVLTVLEGLNYAVDFFCGLVSALANSMVFYTTKTGVQF